MCRFPQASCHRFPALFLISILVIYYGEEIELCPQPYFRVPPAPTPPRLSAYGDMVGASEDDERAARDAMAAVEAAMAAGAEAVFQAGSAKRKRAEESVEVQKRETEKVHAEALAALEAAVSVKEDAEAEAAEIRSKAAAERAALDAEKAAMEKTYAFQTSIIKLDVGGHKFTTSLPTLTSVPNTYLAALFSGRHPLAPSAEGAFFIDRCGAHFDHILNYLRDPGRDEYKYILLATTLTDSPRHIIEGRCRLTQ